MKHLLPDLHFFFSTKIGFGETFIGYQWQLKPNLEKIHTAVNNEFFFFLNNNLADSQHTFS